MEKLLNKIKKLLPRRFFKLVQPVYHFLMSALAAAVYFFPSHKLIVIGVTGTTGKTTTIYFISQMLKNAGYVTGYTSTAMFDDGVKEWQNDKKMTMVGRFFTQKMLRRMVKNGCQFAIIETTSEGIEQFRHRFINYDIIAMTGLYPEHIESHGSFENYRNAKGKLFAHLKKCRSKQVDRDYRVNNNYTGLKKIDLAKIKKEAVINGDDSNAAYFRDFWSESKVVVFEKDRMDEVSFEQIRDENKLAKSERIIIYGDIENNDSGLAFSFIPSLKFFSADKQNAREKLTVNTRLLGKFNALNMMLAVSTGLALGISPEKIRDVLENIAGAAGRLELINEGQDFIVIVDYAFEPNAVAKLYETVADIKHEKTIHVLGSAGGGRDSSRRPVLGGIAGKNADIVMVTNEDPYDDDPLEIINEVAAGAAESGKIEGQDLFKNPDRRSAIRRALSLAKTGDMVLITGKGNEQAICVAGGERIPWDDRRVVREELKKIV